MRVLLDRYSAQRERDGDAARSMTAGRKHNMEFRHHRRYVACPTKFGQKQVELGANDVILALDGHISREEALKVARAVLEGYGHVFVNRNATRRRLRICIFPGGEPRIGLRVPEKNPVAFAKETALARELRKLRNAD